MDKLIELGDAVVDSAAHSDAVAYYSLALTLEPLSMSVLIKRSRAHAATRDWEAALQDANAVRVVGLLSRKLANDMHLRQSYSIHHILAGTRGSMQRSMVVVIMTRQSKHSMRCF